MNNKFKRALSSVLAFTMLCSCVTVMNTSNVFATTYDNSLEGLNVDETITSDKKVTTWTFDGNTVDDSGTQLAAGDIVGGILLTGNGSKRFSTSNKFSVSKTMGFALPISEGCSGGTVAITSTGSNSERNLYINDDKTKGVPYNQKENSIDFTADDVKDGRLAFSNTSSNGDYKMSKIVLTENFSGGGTDDPIPVVGITIDPATAAVAQGKTVSLNVVYEPSNTKEKGVTWETSDSNVATVDNGVVTGIGVGTATITAKSTADAKISGTATITVTEKAVQKTIDGPLNAVNIANELGTPNSDNETLEPGTVVADYFVSSGSDGFKRRTSLSNGVQVNAKGKNAIGFTTTVPLKIVIGCASTGSSNTSSVAVAALDGDNIATIDVKGTGTTTFTIDYLPAGEYVIYAPQTTNTRDARIKTIAFENPVALASVTPSYTINGTALTSGTVNVNGTDYEVGASISLVSGTYAVTYTNGDSEYKGELVFDGKNTAPVVVLEEVAVPTSYDAQIDLTKNPAVVTGADASKVTSSVTFHDGQHGINAGTVTFTKVTQLAKFTLGACQYSNSSATYEIKATDANNKVITGSVTAKLTACDDVVWYLDGVTNELTAPVTVEVTLKDGAYCSHIYAESLSEIPVIITPVDQRGKIITVDPSYTENTGLKYSTVGYALASIATNPTTESERITIQVNNGTYKERIVVSVPYVTIEGASKDNTVITFNDSEANNDTYFHGATVAVIADNFKASNITFQNTAEADGTATDSNGKVKNATVFSLAYAGVSNATAELTNCKLNAERDTAYVGNTSHIKFNGCDIYGFQDVICGNGDLTLDNCHWYIESSYNARLFAPQGTSKIVANNLTISNSKSTAKKAAFARYWGQEKLKADPIIIINGYTDTNGNIVEDKADTYIYGFEYKYVGTNTGEKITDMLWIARKTQSGVFDTTLENINTFDPAYFNKETDENGTSYRIVGKINNKFLGSDDFNAVGFVVSDAEGHTVTLSENMVYNVEGTEDKYTVSFAEDVTEGLKATFRPYVKYQDFDIVGKTETSVDFATANVVG